MTTTITRADLQEAFGNKPKLIRFFEQLFITSTQAAADAKDAGAATGSIQDATVITLGPNAAFNNERVLTAGAGILIDTTDGVRAVLSVLSEIILNGGFQCTFNLIADTNITIPTTGRVPSSTDGPYADDVAAAAAGVNVGEWYAKTGGTVAWRVA